MRYLLIAALLIPSFTTAEEAIPEPRYGYSYTREDVRDAFNSCKVGIKELEAPQDRKDTYCLCLTWHIANQVPKYRFLNMDKEEVNDLFSYINRNWCVNAFNKAEPKKDGASF